MKSRRIPVSFFPTTTFLVDDNRRFLKNISLQLDEHFAYMLFDDPENALELLANAHGTQSLLNKYSVVDSNNINYLNNQYSVNVEIDSIHKEIYNADRFKMVSVVVVDYAMPNMNGIQFCERLLDTRIKKIMMTAEADHQVAVQAFNDGIIDKFILKSDLNLKQILNKSILELQQKFFYELSESIANSMESEPGYCLDDPNVMKIFDNICQENNIVEYHLLDTSGNFLLLDDSGSPSWFVIRNKSELEMYYDFALDAEVQPKLCEQLKRGEKIPYFPNINSCHAVTGVNWESYLYPAKQIEGEEKYYYALLKNIKEPNLLRQNIFSYKDHLSNLYPLNVGFSKGEG